jgi:hypothetical protein
LGKSVERPGPKSVSPAMNCSGVELVVWWKRIVAMGCSSVPRHVPVHRPTRSGFAGTDRVSESDEFALRAVEAVVDLFLDVRPPTRSSTVSPVIYRVEYQPYRIRGNEPLHQNCGPKSSIRAAPADLEAISSRGIAKPAQR